MSSLKWAYLENLQVEAQNNSATTITPEFREAFELLENSRENVFITGKAGTGKSTFLRYFRENTRKNVAIVAPTGIAALNVQGQTIHSFFRLKPKFASLDELRPNKSNLVKKLDLLIIDEISMVRADIFDAIDHTLKLSRKNNKPFGGVQVCVIGDLFQLPPIISNQEQEFFSQFYDSPFFFAANCYQDAFFNIVQFETVHRQNDEEFIGILNAIRSGACDNDKLEVLNARYFPRATPAQGTLVLTTTNALADEINAFKLAQLPSEPRQFKGRLSGDFGLKAGRLPSPEELELKIGAQVMFVKNDSEGRWVNGTIGIVEQILKDSVSVRIDTKSYDIKPEKWQTIAYEFDETLNQITEKPLGTYTQFPLMLAWAITIHKSQGKTLERVIIDLGRGAFAAGQLYVALSRCKTLQGIALKQPVSTTDIVCDAQVVDFMSRV